MSVGQALTSVSYTFLSTFDFFNSPAACSIIRTENPVADHVGILKPAVQETGSVRRATPKVFKALSH